MTKTKISNSNSNLKSLKLLQINARSLAPRQDELSKLVVEKSIDILVVVESWLKPNPDEKIPKISGLTPVSWKHRSAEYKNGRGGGVIIYINPRHLSYKSVDLLQTPTLGVDMCCITVFPSECKDPSKNAKNCLSICGVYSPPVLQHGNGGSVCLMEIVLSVQT